MFLIAERLRIFATKEMKAMTQRHCENLPEVVKRHERAREERRRHGNRLIRDIFNQVLIFSFFYASSN